MIYHQRDQRLRCHHCGAERRAEASCPECGGKQLVAVGAGTERIESVLQELFPQYQTVRIDRDTTRRKGALDALYKQIKHGRGQILVGTQMLAKGHHLPNVTLVGILNADQGLFSADFRASERLAQLVLQVAGRAGRANQPGEVHIQTHFPEHPLWPALLRQDYTAIADTLLAEREQAHLPPFTFMVLFRAEAVQREAPLAFLQRVREILGQGAGGDIEMFGPMPAPMERRAGRYRAQLILQAPERNALHALLRHCLPTVETLKDTRPVRWSVDVDPIDTF
jgi:primosomal protein N' (replication factor Y)